MRRSATVLILFTLVFSWTVPARAYTLQYTGAAAGVRIKWPTATIKIALSHSLSSPPANIKEGSDVVGAARRALARWASAANLQFIESWSDQVAISPSSAGDGISLITVADVPENRAAFASADRTGRTRIYYEAATGTIVEADVLVNPTTQFSTDGTPGTYDLEATFTHEIGHVLGLEHSAEASSAMQPRQGTNGLYEQAALTPRTLSEDDRSGARALYGNVAHFGTIAGTIKSFEGNPVRDAHVWAEDISTGRVVAGNTTLDNGSYSIEGLPPGAYRLVTEYSSETAGKTETGFSRGAEPASTASEAKLSTSESKNRIAIADGEVIQHDISLEQESANLRPQVFGTNGHLSTIAIPVIQAGRHTIFIGGHGVDQVLGSGISVTSPFIKVIPASLTLQSGVNYQFPIISFDVEVAPDALLGDYSIRLQSKTGEVAYISGGLTIDEASGGKMNIAEKLGIGNFLFACLLGST